MARGGLIMKTLYVLRHGQAAPESEVTSDHGRPLTPRGEAEVRMSAEHLAKLPSLPTLVLTSGALRAQSTAELCLASWAKRPELRVTDRLYLAGPSSYLNELAAGGEPHQVAMVVGHNPGLEALVFVLSERSEHLATASWVEIELPISSWNELSGLTRHGGRLVSSFHASG